MKKTLLIAFAILFSNFAFATVYIDETFNYSVANLANEPGWTTAISGGTSINGTGRNVVETPLSYSNSGGYYVLSNTGKSIYSEYLNTSGVTYTASKPIGTTVSSTVYVSFLYKAGTVQGQSQSGVFGLASGTGTGPTLWVGKGTVKASNYRFGITRSSTAGADIKWGSEEFSDVNTTFLIVMKHDFGTGYTSLYINPIIDGTEPTSPIATDNAGTARTSLNNLFFRNTGNNTSRFNIGGVRVSSSWAEAVASSGYTPPVSTALTAPVVGIATNIAAKSFTANWQSVENATGYTVLAYSGTTFVDSITVSGQSITSANFTDMIPELTYTYTVKAKGDGVTYSGSVASASAQMFTLPAATIPANHLQVILKLDDLGVQNSILAASPAFDFLVANNIKWGSGAIANRFDATAPGVLAPYLNAQNPEGEKLMEIWHHGYDHSQNNPAGTWEFSGRSYSDQKLSFENGDQTILNLLGIQMKTFGTPYNQSDATTNTVIAENPGYKVMMFSKIKSSSNGIMYLDNRVNMESATGTPEFAYFKANYLAGKNTYTGYMILQGHPNYYTTGSNNLEQFKLILKYLMSEGVTFVKPYEYYQSTGISTSLPNIDQTENTGFNFKYLGKRNGTVVLNLNEAQTLNCVIYDITGSVVKQVFSKKFDAGNYSIPVENSQLAAGIYVLTVSNGTMSEKKKLLMAD